jgi:hypothetical protein
MKKFIGKPYAGKPHVRIDEGEKRQRRFSLLYWLKKHSTEGGVKRLPFVYL